MTFYWRWAHFTPVEVFSAVGLREYERGNFLLQPDALDMLERFRAQLAVPLVCNGGANTLRGYRAPAENYRAGGQALSRHIQGIAFDLSAPDLDLNTLYEAARHFGWGGVGLYLNNGFVHVDKRPVLNDKVITWMG